jgi:short-subunit dehydrogenase
MGVDTSGNFFRYFMTAEDVVDASLRALQKGKVVCIPGIRYKLAVTAPRFLPRTVMHGLGYVYRWIRQRRKLP